MSEQDLAVDVDALAVEARQFVADAEKATVLLWRAINARTSEQRAFVSREAHALTNPLRERGRRLRERADTLRAVVRSAQLQKGESR